MATKKKLLQAAAGAASGAGLNVEEVFSTYLYEGNGTSQTITNGIDLDGEGGLVWIKRRSQAQGHGLFDTERGEDPYLGTDSSNPPVNASNGVVYNSDGFTNKSNSYFGGSGDGNGEDFASWTFRKAPKFFDVVTYTGNGTGTRQLSHNLDSTIGTIIVKRTDGTGDWWVYHRSARSTNTDGYLRLNLTNAETGSNQIFPASTYNSTQFTVGNSINVSSETYVAYLFAHNDGDGGFGPDGDADIIKCGSYTGNGSNTGPEIDLGFEPQWVMIKASSGAGSWYMFDSMRGIVSDGNDVRLQANQSDADFSSQNAIALQANGFKLENSDGNWNGNGATYIYIAIRRGPMAVPEDATDVFGMSYAEDAINGTFPVDTVITTALSASDNFIRDRLRGTGYLKTNTNDTEVSGGNIGFDHMTGLDSSGWGTGYIHWLWRRAPNYFDVVAYTGTGSARTVSHNLGVAPEMMWIKRRNTLRDWSVYHSALGATKYIILNSTGTPTTVSTWWNDTEPTSSNFTTGGSVGVNGLNDTYIAYLFASLDGVSKVGSYTGNGTTSNTIDCGFSAGARFVLIKRTDSTGDWWVFDTERGITSSGNDPYLELNTTNAEASYNILNANSSGFEIIQPWADINASGGTYLFYAIA